MKARYLNWLPPLAAAAALHAAVAATWPVTREPPPALGEAGSDGIELSLALAGDTVGEPAAEAPPAAPAPAPEPPSPAPRPQPRPQPVAKSAPPPTPAPPETVATAALPTETASTPASSMPAAGDATSARASPATAALTADASLTGGVGRGAGGTAKSRFSGKPARNVRGYFGQIASWIDANKDYPVECKKAKEQGAVLVKFTIDRDGRLLASSIKQSSGHPRLDRAALATLARSAPFPPIPDFVGRETLTVAVPIDYALITD